MNYIIDKDLIGNLNHEQVEMQRLSRFCNEGISLATILIQATIRSCLNASNHLLNVHSLKHLLTSNPILHTKTCVIFLK